MGYVPGPLDRRDSLPLYGRQIYGINLRAAIERNLRRYIERGEGWIHPRDGILNSDIPRGNISTLPSRFSFPEIISPING